MSSSQIVSPDELPSWAPKSDKQRRRWETAGKLPKRIHISPRRHGYVAAELRAAEDRLLADGLAERDRVATAA